jgi:hypothetical protein
MAESFFSSLKTELIYRHSWTSRHDAELAIFAWIEGWYNPERIIAALGMRSPDEYEAAFYADTQNANPATPVRVGVSDERCKWPNTLSCGLAGKGRYDRNTVGRESTIIEGCG